MENTTTAPHCSLAPTTAKSEQNVDPKLLALLPENPFFIPKEKVDQIVAALGYESPVELLPQLLFVASKHAIAAISNFYVGTVGIGKSGNIYLGIPPKKKTPQALV